MTKKRRGLHDPSRAPEPSLFDLGDPLPAPESAPVPAPIPAPAAAPSAPQTTSKPAKPSSASTALPERPMPSSAPASAAAQSPSSSAHLPAQPPPLPRSAQDKPFTVTQLNAYTKQILETAFAGIWVEGEIAEIKLTTQNHLFFKLKDDEAQIDARMWNSYRARLKFIPDAGMKVLIQGRLEFYEKRGLVSLNAWRIEPTGAGALLVALEQLKKKLQTEGLFDRPKRPLPEFPGVIGLVTSPTGAALRDMLHVLRKRFPVARVLISPAQVQGDTAPASIVKALDRLYRHKPCDVIIVGRGGGSGDDLAAFNAENVVRAIARSPVPIVSAVGHETDITLADFAADHRAPTPTAAAQTVTPDRRALIDYLRQRTADQREWIVARLLRQADAAADHELHLRRARPAGRLLTQAQLWVDLDETLRAGVHDRLQNAAADWQTHRERISTQTLRLQLTAAAERIRQATQAFPRDSRRLLAHYAETLARHGERLQALSPLNTLARGFSVTQAVQADGRTGEVLRTVSQARRAKRLRTRLQDGDVDSEILP